MGSLSEVMFLKMVREVGRGEKRRTRSFNVNQTAHLDIFILFLPLLPSNNSLNPQHMGTGGTSRSNGNMADRKTTHVQREREGERKKERERPGGPLRLPPVRIRKKNMPGRVFLPSVVLALQHRGGLYFSRVADTDTHTPPHHPTACMTRPVHLSNPCF